MGYFSGLLCEKLKITLDNITILPLVSYGCEAWFLALSEAHKFRVFGKNVLRRIFRLKRNSVTEVWNKFIFLLMENY
jgi:hypothetical protein